MDAIDSVVEHLREFSKDSVHLVKCCHKPDRKEYTKVAFRTAIGLSLVLREVDLHSDQQYHRWICLVNADLVRLVGI